jgi:hypothetical protein
MKKTALFFLIPLGLAPLLFSSCNSAGGTAGNGTGSYVKATEGSGGVQWSGGNNVTGSAD